MTIETITTLGRELGEVQDSEAGVPWINSSGVEIAEVKSHVDRVSREIARWVTQSRGNAPSLLNRVAYRAPANPYAQMETAKSAVENDDIVGGTCDVTEALMFQGIKWEGENADDADIFNQIARDLNLDDFARQWHREDFANSQAYVGMWWARKEYSPRSKKKKGERGRPGPKPRAKAIYCPVAWTFLDPHKIVPLRPGAFGQDRLAWLATDQEIETWMKLEDDPFLDPVMAEFMVGPAAIDRDERRYLAGIGVDWRRLIELNPAKVFRISQTKMSYERFPAVRLKSVFALLDLKQQLIEADRVSLVGAANFILLVRQGSKEEPAQQAEIDNLKENFKVVAKLPVVVGDHRLSIDIITPDQEHVLDAQKYETIDRRILHRCIGALTIGGTTSGSSAGSGTTLMRGISRMLENRRHMMKRTLENEIGRRIVDHPANEGIFSTEPNVAFTPRNVQIDADSEITKSMLALRTQKEISRETVLEYFGLDQAVESLRREFEEEHYDDIFKTAVPFSAAGEAPAVSGARGGRPDGGGDSPQSPQGQTGGRSDNGNPST